MIDHLAFVVSDPEQTAETLASFGYQIHRKTAHHGGSVEVVDPAQPGLVLELCSKREQDTVGFDHACLRLADEGAYQAASASVNFTGTLHLSPDSGRQINNFRDADNVKWQVTF